MQLRVVLALAIAVFLTGLRGAAAQPSWCKYARSQAEIEICTSPGLWDLDACEDQLFRKAKVSAPPSGRQSIDAAEKTWLAERNACGHDASCIESRYRDRASQLDARATCAAPAAAASPPAPVASPVAASAARCDAPSVASRMATNVSVSSNTPKQVAHGGRIEVAWRLPPPDPSPARVFLVGAMPDSVRFEGQFHYDENGTMDRGPGFVALTGASRAPFGIQFGAGRTRVIIPVHDVDIARTGKLSVKPYLAGPLAIEWALVAVTPGCNGGEASVPVATLGSFEVAAGEPTIVVQDFVAPDPKLELAATDQPQRIQDVELTADGRYRLETFPRRYRVFDRTSGAKIVDRSGVKPRFSPSGRFVVASIGDPGKLFPTNFEVIDLVAGKPVGNASGPIAAWSNGEALLLDGGHAYQSVSFIGTLIEPELSAEGYAANWPYFSPGCVTCDAWASSNITVDWDGLLSLRGDAGNADAKEAVSLASGRKVDASLDDDEAGQLKAYLQRAYGRAEVILAKGWTSSPALKLTHVGRGYEGYTDEENSLQPTEKGRPSQTAFLAPRRLALADGRILRAEDLKPTQEVRGQTRAAWRSVPARRSIALDSGYVNDELAKLGLQPSPATAIPEVPIPIADEHSTVIRTWPGALEAEVAALNPSLNTWFKNTGDEADVIVAAWRFEDRGTRYLLLQHGDRAMTINGAHDLRFDLLVASGPARSELHTFKEISGLFSQFVGREHTVARVSILEGGRLIVAIPGTGKAAIIELNAAFKASAIAMAEPTLLCGFYGNAGRALVTENNCDGQFFIYDPQRSASPILSGRVVDEELIVYNAQGYYAATYEGAHFVHVGFPGMAGVHSFEQFAHVLDRPDFIRDILGGRRATLPSPALLPPPDLTLTAGPETPAGMEITVEASSGSGLAAIEFHEDGRLELRQPLSGTAVRQTISIAKRPHVRTLTGVAIDSMGFKSRPVTLDLPRGTAANTLHVVAVGVDDYDRLNPLQGAKADAAALVAGLKTSALAYYRDVKTTMRADRAATAAIIQADLRAAVEAAGPDDTILVFFAGHGGGSDDGRYFMALSQSDPDRLPETAFDWQTMADILSQARGRVIVIIDACHSGQTGTVQGTNDAAVASLATKTAAPMVVFAASKGRQSSEEMAGQSGGVFTQTLARLLSRDRAATDSNGDGVLEVSELYRALKVAVEASTDGRQTPWIVRRNMIGDVPLF